MIDLSKRKGARSIKDIPDNILQQLNAGEIETANLVEGLAINQIQLLENFLAQNDRTFYLKSVLASVNKQSFHIILSLKPSDQSFFCSLIGIMIQLCSHLYRVIRQILFVVGVLTLLQVISPYL